MLNVGNVISRELLTLLLMHLSEKYNYVKIDDEDINELGW